MTGIARFVQDKELKKSCEKPMDWGQRLLAQASLNYFLNAVFNEKGRNIHSTETGRILIQALPDIATQPDMTAHWEAQLTDISQNKLLINNLCIT